MKKYLVIAVTLLALTGCKEEETRIRDIRSGNIGPYLIEICLNNVTYWAGTTEKYKYGYGFLAVKYLPGGEIQPC